VLAWIAGRRYGLSRRAIVGLAVVSVGIAFVFGFLIWPGVVIATAPYD